jgi:hypothetical protein
MENTDRKQNSSEEIDMTQFFRWVGRGFNRVGNSFIYSLALFRNIFFKNLLFFGILITAGIILGVVYSKVLQKKYYKATMVLSCDYINTQILDNTIQKLNLLANEPDGAGLARELKIEPAVARSVLDFDSKAFVSEDDVVEMEVLREQLNSVAAEKKDLVEKVLTQLHIDNKNAYEITVHVLDPEILKDLEGSMTNYFRQNNYVKNRIEISQKNLQVRRSKLVSETRKLDSLKAVMYLNLQSLSKANRGSNNVFLNEETLTDPLEVFKEDLALNRELLDIEKSLYLRSDFEIIDGFTAIKSPENASLPVVVIISFFASFVLGYILLGLKRFDRKLASIPVED